MFGLFGRRIEDEREEYARDVDGNVLAFVVSGEERDDLPGTFATAEHEDFIHDGTPHQNPVVIERTELHWFLFIPYTVRVQDRYYPITRGRDGATRADLEGIQQRVDSKRRKLRRRSQRAYIAPLDERKERLAYRRENATQRARGVPQRRLRGQPRRARRQRRAYR